jgi:DNA mismatch repair ATPase MutS/predicted GIY-YIG superfamily endonuclease
MILKAEAEYRSAIEESKQRAKSHMKNLCREISENFLHALIFLSHWGVVVTSVYMHAESSIRKGWSLPSTTSDGCSIIDQVWPYWLELNRPAVANTVTLTDGHTAILTAPNMSGKSTLIRSIGAAILLGNAGLMAPCKSATVQEISDLIIVSPAGDRPSEGLSAFAAEADAMASAIKHSNSDNSVLLLVDEFGRGTSGRDAAALTTAVIKWLAQRNNVACVWATHLHELFTVPNLEVSWIQMDGFKLVSGQCVDSRGIDIAASHGFPDDVIKEARRHTQAEHTMPVELCPIERALKSVSCNMDDLVRLDTDCVLPPNLQAAHVLYILKMTSGALYVGETANLTQRLKAHYKKYQVGHVWVIPQANRTHARALESSLIRELLKEAVPLVSKTDGFKSQIASVTA